MVSVPVVGSVTAIDCSRSSPLAMSGRYCRFCSSEPWRSSVPMLYIWPWQAPALPPRAVDLLHDHRGLGQAEAGAAVLLRDQRGEPAGLGQRLDEGFRIAALGVDLLPVRRRSRGTARAAPRAFPGTDRARGSGFSSGSCLGELIFGLQPPWCCTWRLRSKFAACHPASQRPAAQCVGAIDRACSASKPDR